jgi:CarboxypepD_reg-like domain
MKMRTSIIVFVLISFPFVAFSQDLQKISGKVIDEETKEPLSYASVLIKEKQIGTVTNADGEFDFYIPSLYTQDTLLISMMGYSSYQVVVADIKLSQKLLVRLAIKSIQLSEVVITDAKITAKEIITKAFENVENNYPVKPYKLSGFYRETHQENERSVMLVEAALDIYDNGYKPTGNKPPEREKINLVNSRVSKNYRNDLFSNTGREKWNLVAGALSYNPVKYPDPNIRKKRTSKDFTIDSITYYNDRLVYVISFFSYIPRFPNFERKNTLYVDALNYSIYKYGWEEYAKKEKYSETPWRLSKDSFYFSKRKRISTIYEFGEYQGKMFLKYFDEKAIDDIYNSKGDSVEFETLGHVTMVVTEIETEKMEVEETMRRDQSIHSQVKEYNPSFWSNHDQIKLVPLTKKQIKDLEWEMPLEEQFKKQVIKK